MIKQMYNSVRLIAQDGETVLAEMPCTTEKSHMFIKLLINEIGQQAVANYNLGVRDGKEALKQKLVDRMDAITKGIKGPMKKQLYNLSEIAAWLGWLEDMDETWGHSHHPIRDLRDHKIGIDAFINGKKTLWQKIKLWWEGWY